MAKNMQPVAKRCKALGISPAAMGYAKKDTKRTRRLRAGGYADATNVDAVRKMIPYK